MYTCPFSVYFRADKMASVRVASQPERHLYRKLPLNAGREESLQSISAYAVAQKIAKIAKIAKSA